jgi:glycerophosphoryl diester phosphodiesterase
LKLGDKFLKHVRPLVIAHRGNKALYPENTLLALEDAVELGVDALEVDARLTRDGQLVIFHDETLERTTDGQGSISEKTLAELQELDAGFRFTVDKGSTFPYRGKGLKIPTLQDGFERFPEMLFNIDIKNPDPLAVDALVFLIQEYQREEFVLIGSFHDDQIRLFRSKMPNVITAACPSEVKRFLFAKRVHLTRLIRPGYNAFQVPLAVQQQSKPARMVEIVTPSFIQQAHSKGVAVMVWTINDPKVMKKLIEWGVDGIFTDDPKTLLEIANK